MLLRIWWIQWLVIARCIMLTNGDPEIRSNFILQSASSFQNSINLDFEGIGNLEPVGDYYYAQYHIKFSPDATAIVAQYAGGNGNFAGEPTPYTAMTFTSGTAYMNIPGK